jgi:hypothetical protein
MLLHFKSEEFECAFAAWIDFQKMSKLVDAGVKTPAYLRITLR